MIIQTNTIAFNEKQLVLNQKVKQLFVCQKTDVEITDVFSLTINAAIEADLWKCEAELKNLQKLRVSFSCQIIAMYLTLPAVKNKK